MKDSSLIDVSVVIPTYNRPALLRETIASVLAQTVKPREIIIVDNGTTDETKRFIEAHGTRNLRYVRIPPEGLQAARNAGIREAVGEWIAMLDDDDLWRSDFLEVAYRAISDGRADAIFADNQKFRIEDGEVIRWPWTNFEKAPPEIWTDVPRPENGAAWSFIGKFPVERLLSFNPFYQSAMIARKALLEKIGGYDPAMRGIGAEDMEFLIRLLPEAQVAVIWKPMFDYRIHASNDSGGSLLAQAIGRWQIFEMVAARRAGGHQRLAAALAENLPERRTTLYDRAWAAGRFDITARLDPLLRAGDWTAKRRLKRMIQAAPVPLRTLVLQLSLPFRHKHLATLAPPKARS